MERISISGGNRKALYTKEIGAIGIGAMIVFIAMVLVAGIAASVLVQTSTMLETQAMISGQETIVEVSSGLAVMGIEGKNESGSIVRIAVEIRTRAGSMDVDLSETVIEISDSSSKNIFTYNSSNFTAKADIDGDIFTSSKFPYNNATTFGIIVIEDADESCSSSNPVINAGDHLMLSINVSAAFGGFGTNIDVFGAVIPEEGSYGVISFSTPSVFNNIIVELQ